VVIEPDPKAPDGVALTVHGALAEVLALCQGTKPQRRNPRGRGHGGSGIDQLSVVAGACNQLYPDLLKIEKNYTVY
jgi:hypothetical protein